jgi:hypothetical protein
MLFETRLADAEREAAALESAQRDLAAAKAELAAILSGQPDRESLRREMDARRDEWLKPAPRSRDTHHRPG